MTSNYKSVLPSVLAVKGTEHQPHTYVWYVLHMHIFHNQWSVIPSFHCMQCTNKRLVFKTSTKVHKLTQTWNAAVTKKKPTNTLVNTRQI